MSQLELFDKMITINICSSKGHQLIILELSEAKEFIVKEFNKLGLWLYIDGIQVNPINMDINLHPSAKNIILTHALVGG